MTDSIADDITRALVAGRAYLVTGAGFSHGAMNVRGDPVPSTRKLTELLYQTFRSGPVPDDLQLGDVFDLARLRDADAVKTVLKQHLSVDPAAPVPGLVDEYLALPWARIYTFNLDDLAEVSAAHTGHDIVAASALITVPAAGITYVHVNGDMDDGVNATFSERQYAERLARRDPWLMTMGAELLSGTVIYVGTTVRELHLWTAIEARRVDTVLSLDPRPRSYLVTPHLDDTRREMLAYSRIEWVEADRDQFAADVLAAVDHDRLAARPRRLWDTRFWWRPVEAPVNDSEAESRYLLGQQPGWGDVQYIAVQRTFEAGLGATSGPRLLVITGTPGVGKTTTAMKFALASVANGREVRFVDIEDLDSYGDLLHEVRKTRDPYDLVLDSAELLGSWLPSVANEYFQRNPEGVLVVVAPKKRIEALRLPEIGTEAEIVEVPLLDESDAAALVDVLGRFDLLGHLEGRTRAEQEHELSSRSGSQLLVAMIRATQGEEHQARVIAEYQSLDADDRAVYGVVSLARDLRYRLKQPELLLAVGTGALIATERLEAAGTLIRRDGTIQPRHARIAEIVVSAMKASGELLDAWIWLTQGLAVGHDIENRFTRVTRTIARLINHDEVKRHLGTDGGRRFYHDVRDHLGRDHHYWLQRGNFELGSHDGLPAARRFLEASRARSGGDPFVEVAWGDLLFAEALAAASDATAEKAEVAFTHITGLFAGFGLDNPYPYGVAAKGCLRLAEDAKGLRPSDRKLWLKRALDDVLDEGIRVHRQDRELQDLRSRTLRAFTQVGGGGRRARRHRPHSSS